MSGANCYSQDYSVLQHLLASRGYLVVVADHLHPVPDVRFLSSELECSTCTALACIAT